MVDARVFGVMCIALALSLGSIGALAYTVLLRVQYLDDKIDRLLRRKGN